MMIVSVAFRQDSRCGLGVTVLECAGIQRAFHHTGHFISPGWGLVLSIINAFGLFYFYLFTIHFLQYSHKVLM